MHDELFRTTNCLYYIDTTKDFWKESERAHSLWSSWQSGAPKNCISSSVQLEQSRWEMLISCNVRLNSCNTFAKIAISVASGFWSLLPSFIWPLRSYFSWNASGTKCRRLMGFFWHTSVRNTKLFRIWVSNIEHTTDSDSNVESAIHSIQEWHISSANENIGSEARNE